jgi:RNA polymerase sigma factor (TIGR02999 family)
MEDPTHDQKASLDEMLPGYYSELRRLAQVYLSGERPNHTLQPTALVHEAYLRLAGQHNIDWACRPQVLALAATMMRRILVNHAKARAAHKRDAGIQIELDRELELIEGGQIRIEPLDEALNRLAALDSRQASIVEMRFFAGLNVEETASALGVSSATIKREWRTARLWLMRELESA